MKTWLEFRAQLFEIMETRRSKAALFLFAQIYIFIIHCKTLFETPGTKAAQNGLAQIRDEGTFLLVADSLKAFVGLFPNKAPVEATQKPVPRQAPTAPHSTNDNPQASAASSRDAVATEPGLQRPGSRLTEQPPSPSQPTSDAARRSSGRPFWR